MLTQFHKKMIKEALSTRMSPRALEIVTAANIRQDSPRGQFGHDEYHFDNNAFDKGYRYMNEQRGLVLASLLSPGVLSAWIAFGRLLHSAQDFYAHTNYVTMWLDAHAHNGTHPPPSEIDPLQEDLIESPKLHSGRVYFPMDIIYFIPPLRKLALALLPHDSHGWMNLDSPKQGIKFDYAQAAATKRTQHEFETLEKILTPEMFSKFTDI
jgi:hypothetical protein